MAHYRAIESVLEASNSIHFWQCEKFNDFASTDDVRTVGWQGLKRGKFPAMHFPYPNQLIAFWVDLSLAETTIAPFPEPCYEVLVSLNGRIMSAEGFFVSQFRKSAKDRIWDAAGHDENEKSQNYWGIS